jgi:hypothetical protein
MWHVRVSKWRLRLRVKGAGIELIRATVSQTVAIDKEQQILAGKARTFD